MACSHVAVFVMLDFESYTTKVYRGLRGLQVFPAISMEKGCNIYRLRGTPMIIRYRIFSAICKYYRVSPQHTQSFPLMSIGFFCDSYSPFPQILQGKPTGTLEAESISLCFLNISLCFLMISVWLCNLQVITGQTEEGFYLKKGFCEPKLTLSGAMGRAMKQQEKWFCKLGFFFQVAGRTTFLPPSKSLLRVQIKSLSGCQYLS